MPVKILPSLRYAVGNDIFLSVEHKTPVLITSTLDGQPEKHVFFLICRTTDTTCMVQTIITQMCSLIV